MSANQRLYIAGMGMITSVGGDTATTTAAVNAGISAYGISGFYGQNDLPITMASVPNSIFLKMEADIDPGDCYSDHHDRVIKMAITAIREASAEKETEKAVPMVLAMPEQQGDIEGLVPFIPTLESNCQPWISADMTRSIYSGRAAGIEAIDFAFKYFYDLPHDFMLIGGSDSYQDEERLAPLTKTERLLVKNCPDGFAPGEAAGFLLLTNNPELALARDGHIIALHPPGLAEEPGHLSSEEPYRGEGLDAAFKQALNNHQPSSIHSIYSSMNGENHWAKEYGVAYLRNKEFFKDPVRIEHPADCYGDLGAATSPVLIALAAEHLFSDKTAKKHLIYSSSDHSRRGAMVMEKIAFAAGSAANHQQPLANQV